MAMRALCRRTGWGAAAGYVKAPTAVPRRSLALRSAAPVAAQLRGTAAAAARALAQSRRMLHVSAPQLARVVPFNLADIGEAIAEVQIVEWYVQVGDTVEEFENVCLVESDKASVAITSRFSGKVVALHYDEGDMAATGSALCDIEVNDDTDIPDDVEQRNEAPADTTAPPEPTAADAPSGDGATSAGGGAHKLLMTPAVRRIVKEHNLDLSLVTPTGKNNRVLKEDVLRFLENEAATAATPPPPPPPPPTAAATSAAPPPAAAPTPVTRAVPLGEDKVVPIKGLQRTMVKTMVAAASVPVFGYSDEIDMSGLVTTRAELKAMAEARGVKLSYLPFIMKAVSLALREYPILNAHVDAECTEMVYKAEHNISLAMQTPSGLLVPNVKNCEARSVLEIAEEINRLQALGSQGLLGPDDLKGGTFALSNIGVVGGTYCTPILVVPQVVIGALGGLRTLPRFDDDGNVVAATVMEVSWTADHRVIDGVTMAEFSNLWKSYLANPASMLLELR
mmetsp:Transcript_7622/g.19672  ORF Transcript_7622/g.19672 Transcript_7622/m.19672 type:complete len:508 (-) Transcript_7622:90-1613(-)